MTLPFIVVPWENEIVKSPKTNATITAMRIPQLKI